jgi:APA family basic amino acid/polyamine antiporter
MATPPAKPFGYWTLTFLVIANMLGAGVFTTSGFTLASLHSPTLVLLAWLVGGIIACCGAYSYGLLTRRHPESGGEYAFLSRTIHPAVGFIAGWVSLLAGFSGAIAFAALALESYCKPAALPPRLLAITIVLIGAAAHGLHRHLGAKFQNAAVLLKLILLAAFLAIGTWSATTAPWQGLPTAPTPTTFPTLAFAQALVWISLSYSGFNAAVYVAGEAENPNIVAKSLITGTLAVTLLYLLLNATFILAPPANLISGRADIATLAAQWIAGPSFATLVKTIIALALITSVLSMMMAGPRVYSRMAQDRLLPQIFIIRPHRTWPPVLLQAAVAILLILAGTIQNLLAYLGLTLSLCAATSVASLFRAPREKRPPPLLSIPPILFILATLTAATLLAIRDPLQTAGTATTLLLGTLAYLNSSKTR